MVDKTWQYSWWWQSKHLSPKEMEKMKKIMRKVPEIQLKNEIYHSKEEKEADKILNKLWEIK